MSKRFQYIPSFDGVRGVAILSVLLMHGSYGFVMGGWIGVDLFFVLSGYLITSLLQNEYNATGKVTFAKFYARRGLRLFPPLLIGLALANILWPLCHPAPEVSRSIANLAGLFYFANCIPIGLLGPLSPLWSLSVEEHFYLIWPLLAAALVFRFLFVFGYYS